MSIVNFLIESGNFILDLNLEGLGAIGAPWGSSEAATLRSDITENPIRYAAIALGVLTTGRLIYRRFVASKTTRSAELLSELKKVEESNLTAGEKRAKRDLENLLQKVVRAQLSGSDDPSRPLLHMTQV